MTRLEWVAGADAAGVPEHLMFVREGHVIVVGEVEPHGDMPPVTGAGVADAPDVLTIITRARDRAIAAWSAARSAAWSAAWSAARSAARSAAESACAPTVTALQASAQELIRELCAMADEVES